MTIDLFYVELTGALFGIVCVILAAKQNIWTWPTGIIAVLVSVIFYYSKTMYASMYLQFVFLGFCVAGWIQWLYVGKDNERLKVTSVRGWYALGLFVFTMLSFILMGFVFDIYSNDQLPYLDAFATALSITAQWMMNNKQLESWLVWIIADITYTGIHYYMHDWFYFLLYLSYIFSAALAYFLWKKSLKEQVSV
jgi:nicotinamide mononucleotide transporter